MTFPLHAVKDLPRKPRPWLVPLACGFGSGLGVFLISLPFVYPTLVRPVTTARIAAPPRQAPAVAPAVATAQPKSMPLRDLAGMSSEDRLYAAAALAKAFCLDLEGNQAAAPALALALQNRGLQTSVASEPSIQDLAKPLVRNTCPQLVGAS